MFHIFYSWFNNIYGQNLYDYLSGLDCDRVVSFPDQFITIGLITFAIAILVVALFYALPHTRFSKWYHWLITMGCVFVISLLVGWGYTYNKYQNGLIPVYHLYGYDNVTYVGEGEASASGEEWEEDEFETIESEDDGSFTGGCGNLQAASGAEKQITDGTLWLFGLANGLIAVLVFFILSIIVKRFSKDCKHTPWRSVWP